MNQDITRGMISTPRAIWSQYGYGEGRKHRKEAYHVAEEAGSRGSCMGIGCSKDDGPRNDQQRISVTHERSPETVGEADWRAKARCSCHG